jgi:hypothetical protein
MGGVFHGAANRGTSHGNKFLADGGRDASAPLDAGWLRRLCFDTAADDVSFMEVDRAEFASQRAEIDALLPGTGTLIVLDAQCQRFNNQDLLAQSQTAVTTDLT